jgi:hypothetical protein
MALVAAPAGFHARGGPLSAPPAPGRPRAGALTRATAPLASLAAAGGRPGAPARRAPLAPTRRAAAAAPLLRTRSAQRGLPRSLGRRAHAPPPRAAAGGKEPGAADNGSGAAGAGAATSGATSTSTSDDDGDANAQRAASGAAASTSGGGGAGAPGGGGRRGRGRGGQQPSWLQRAFGGVQITQPWRIVLNVVALFLLIRLWPVGGRGLGGRPESITLQVGGEGGGGGGGVRIGFAAAAPAVACRRRPTYALHAAAQVPFSEFVRRVRANDVSSVSVDGLDIHFSLKPDSSLLKDPPAGAEGTRVGVAEGLRAWRGGRHRHSAAGRQHARPRRPTSSRAVPLTPPSPVPAATPQVSFSTVRPPDYSLPYAVLEGNGVSFAAVDKRGNWLLSVMVYGLYAVLLLSALNRLPIKLPAKGTGRKHRGGGGSRGGTGGDGGARKGSGGSAVLFADVAGVDEAKEELQEIVVGGGSEGRFRQTGAMRERFTWVAEAGSKLAAPAPLTAPRRLNRFVPLRSTSARPRSLRASARARPAACCLWARQVKAAASAEGGAVQGDFPVRAAHGEMRRAASCGGVRRRAADATISASGRRSSAARPSTYARPCSRHRQDAPCARRRGRGRRPLLLHRRVRVCGALRGHGRDARARAVCQRTQGGAGDCFHRRNRRGG